MTSEENPVPTADQKPIPNESGPALTLKQEWEKRYEDGLKVAENNIAKDLLEAGENLKVIRAMNDEEFAAWNAKFNFPPPTFIEIGRVFQAMKAEETAIAAKKEREVVEAKKKALADDAAKAKGDEEPVNKDLPEDYKEKLDKENAENKKIEEGLGKDSKPVDEGKEKK